MREATANRCSGDKSPVRPASRRDGFCSSQSSWQPRLYNSSRRRGSCRSARRSDRRGRDGPASSRLSRLGDPTADDADRSAPRRCRVVGSTRLRALLLHQRTRREHRHGERGVLGDLRRAELGRPGKRAAGEMPAEKLVAEPGGTTIGERALWRVRRQPCDAERGRGHAIRLPRCDQIRTARSAGSALGRL